MCSAAVLDPPHGGASAGTLSILAEAEAMQDAPVVDGLRAELTTLRRAINLLELRFADLAFALEQREEWLDPSVETPSSFLREECHMTTYTARSALAVGAERSHLPQAVTAVARGEIGFGHLALLARTSASVRESLACRGLPASGPLFAEGPLLKQAKRQSVNRFRRTCSHLRHALDAPGVLDEHNQLAEGRSLEVMARDDGCVEIIGWLDPEGGAVLRTALAPLARRQGPGDRRNLARRQGDALVEFVIRGLDAGTVPTSVGARPHLQVTASLDTLQGNPGCPAGELELAATVPAATVQRLACDASVTRIVFGPDSVITDVGRAMRVPGAAARRALHSRDRGCVWPGCDRTASLTAAHHVVHWARGGRTELSNLVLLCHHHHRRVHEGGWQIARAEDGSIATVPPIDTGWPRQPD